MDDNGKLFGILGLVSAIIGVLILPVLFGPGGVLFGIIGVNKKNRLGWAGIILGGIEILVAFVQISIAICE